MRARHREWLAGEYDLTPCRDPDLVLAAIDAARNWLTHDRPDLDRIAYPVMARG